jgi:GNAT superfamily N-acetyltransferase
MRPADAATKQSALAASPHHKQIHIRAALEADAAPMHELRCRVRENRLARPGRVLESSYRPYIRAGTAWVAELAGSILGFAVLDLGRCSVWALFVAPEAERMGIGRALHSRIVEEARRHGAAALSLDTSPGTRAARFYLAAGWQEEGVTPDGELRFRLQLQP